ncbi:MAG: 4Fe-4S dicluster domain-containing protein [Anaerovoracaceae bacterium]
MADPIVNIDSKQCKGCEICIAICPKKVFSKSNLRNNYGTVLPKVDSGKVCVECRMCERLCPDGAIDVKGSKDSEN